MNKSNKLLSDIVTFRTYAKYLPNFNRRETFEETINRKLIMDLDKFGGYSKSLSRDIIKAYQQVHDYKIMPSMRGLQFSGEAVLRNNLRQYNCFSGYTEFVTDEGIKRFVDFEDGDEVNILSRRGFKKATIKKFGEEHLLELVVGKGRRKKSIFTTANHRWNTIVKNGSSTKLVIKTTEELKDGDVLQRTHSGNRSKELKPCKTAIQHGIVFGDGTTESDGSTCITLCGDSVELIKHIDLGHIVNRGIKGAVVDNKKIVKNLPYFFKQLPDIKANKEYLLGFLQGWVAADGSIGKNGSIITLDCANKKHLQWARGAFAKLNIFCDDIKVLREKSPFDGSDKPLYRLSINTEDLYKEFFLKTNHYERYGQCENKFPNYKVVSVNKTDRKERVWCVQEPEKEDFTLSYGIVTKNCSFLAVDDVRSFGETLYLLLSGCGVGFSVQKQHISNLPMVKRPKEEGRFIIHDSIEGWAQALDVLMESYFYGRIRPVFDFTHIRPKGSYLVTTGAKAPGPEPLKAMLSKVDQILREAKGRRLRPLEVHDIICIVADCVLAGGIRRAALISLFDKDEEDMLTCKSGEWWVKYPYRARANNSVILERETTTKEEFDYIYQKCRESGAGEPGISWTNNSYEMGFNPCHEISLHSNQLCNLTTVNQTGIGSKKEFLSRVYSATLLGTLQAAYTDFPYVRPKWQEVTEREALLGVSFTGIADANGIVNAEWLKEGAKLVLEVNEKYAKKLGINLAARATAIKPEGSASCALGSSSGIHARHSKYYLRRVRMNKDDALAAYLSSAIPDLVEDDLFSSSGIVVTIPQESPDKAIIKDNETAMSLFRRTMLYNRNWVRGGHRSGDNMHNVSATISVRDDEWDELREAMWEHRDLYSGISLLPFDGGTYQQAPFESCDQEVFQRFTNLVNDIDLKQVVEEEDNTNRAEIVACSGNVCEIV